MHRIDRQAVQGNVYLGDEASPVDLQPAGKRQRFPRSVDQVGRGTYVAFSQVGGYREVEMPDAARPDGQRVDAQGGFRDDRSLGIGPGEMEKSVQIAFQRDVVAQEYRSREIERTDLQPQVHRIARGVESPGSDHRLPGGHFERIDAHLAALHVPYDTVAPGDSLAAEAPAEVFQVDPRGKEAHDDVPLRVVFLVGVEVEGDAVRAVPLVKVAADGQAVRVALCGAVQAFDAVHRIDEFVGLEGQHVGQGGVEAHLKRIDQDVPVIDPIGQDFEREIIARSIDPPAEMRAPVEDQGGIDDLYVRGGDVELEVVLLSGGYFLFPVGLEARKQPVGHRGGDLGKEVVALDVAVEQVFGFDRKAAGKAVDLFGGDADPVDVVVVVAVVVAHLREIDRSQHVIRSRTGELRPDRAAQIDDAVLHQSQGMEVALVQVHVQTGVQRAFPLPPFHPGGDLGCQIRIVYRRLDGQHPAFQTGLQGDAGVGVLPEFQQRDRRAEFYRSVLRTETLPPDVGKEGGFPQAPRAGEQAGIDVFQYRTRRIAGVFAVPQVGGLSAQEDPPVLAGGERDDGGYVAFFQGEQPAAREVGHRGEFVERLPGELPCSGAFGHGESFPGQYPEIFQHDASAAFPQ